MKVSEWAIVLTLTFALASAVFGSMVWVDSTYVAKDTLAAYMEQVLERLQSIEEALR